nr:hypothetical protein [Tanacetum cinerariifolium]
MLEAVASHDLWLLHAFFGVAGADNDIIVLDNSPLFDDLLDDKVLVALFLVNGVGIEKGYNLADGIYLQWATFIKSFTVASDSKHCYFKKRHERMSNVLLVFFKDVGGKEIKKDTKILDQGKKVEGNTKEIAKGKKDNVHDKGKSKMVIEEEKDKPECPWVLYISKGDKGKWLVMTYREEHKCLQSRKIKTCTSTFLSKHIQDLLVMNLEMSVKAIQEQMQKIHVRINKTRAFRAKAKTQVHLKGDVDVQYSLLRDYVYDLKKSNPNTTIKIDVYGTQAGTQGASQSASQAGGNVIRSQAVAPVSPMRRTKKSASRPTPTKGLFSSFDANSELMLLPDERNCFISISVNRRKTHASWGMLECGTETLFSQQAEHELLQTVREFHVCKHEEEQFISSYVLKMKSYVDNLESLGHLVSLNLAVSLILVSLRKEYDSFVQNYNMHGMGKMKKINKNKKPQLAVRGNNQGRGKSKLYYAPKPKIPHPPKKENPAKDSVCHQCGDTSYWKRKSHQYLSELLKNKKLSQGASTSGVFTIELFSFPENQLGKTIKSLRSDRGGEYMSQEFLDHLKEHDIISHRTPPYTPQYNGVFERRNRTLLDMVRSMMSQTTLLKSLWDYALESAARILNMVPTKQIDDEEYELGDLNEPANYKAALLDPEFDKCLDAMNVEMQSIKDNKTGIDGAVHIYKVRLVAKGFTQTYEVDYEETFSPIADIRAIRILIAIIEFYDYEIWQMDVKTASSMDISQKRFYMENSKRGSIPMQEKLKLSKSLGASTPTEKNTKQSIFATLSAEAEYISASDTSKEAVWVRKFISGLGVVPTI